MSDGKKTGVMDKYSFLPVSVDLYSSFCPPVPLALPCIPGIEQITKKTQSDISNAYIPWGFVSQKKILEKVTPCREHAEVVETRAERLNLDTQEFLAVRNKANVT